MWLILGAVFLAIGLIYMIIPHLLLHYLGLGSWKRQYLPGITLTFDDGPNPMSTRPLLDVLDRHETKAIFFLVGNEAAKYPELVSEILKRGHQIGLHGEIHQHAWLMGPIATWRNWTQGKQTLEDLSCAPLRWMRPPWGAFNLASLIWLKVEGLDSILWDAHSHDWNEESPDVIVNQILKQVHEGSIIVLHEFRKEKWSYENTILAVDLMLEKIKTDRKLPMVELELPDQSMLRRLVFRVWELWERFYARTNGIQRIDTTNIYRLGLITYRGENILNERGEVLAKEGDTVAELHLDSARMQTGSTNPARIAIESLLKTKKSLPGLAAFIQREPDFKDIKILVSVTLINRGLSRLGFQVQELPQTVHVRWMGVLQRMILRIYHPTGQARKAHMGVPKMVWISKEELLRRWLFKNIETK